MNWRNVQKKIQMKVYLYQYPLLKVSVLEESEKMAQADKENW